MPRARPGPEEDAPYPDALIDCGLPEPGALCAREPVAAFEVLFKKELADRASNRRFNLRQF